MKKYLFLLVCVYFSIINFSFAQENSSQYCGVWHSKYTPAIIIENINGIFFIKWKYDSLHTDGGMNGDLRWIYNLLLFETNPVDMTNNNLSLVIYSKEMKIEQTFYYKTNKLFRKVIIDDEKLFDDEELLNEKVFNKLSDNKKTSFDTYLFEKLNNENKDKKYDKMMKNQN